MKAKTIIISILLTLVAVVLFQNREESTFWLFGEIRTSKLIILGIFFLSGMVTGALLFRRRRKHPKEYNISNDVPTEDRPQLTNPYNATNLSTEDQEYIRND